MEIGKATASPQPLRSPELLGVGGALPNSLTWLFGETRLEIPIGLNGLVSGRASPITTKKCDLPQHPFIHTLHSPPHFYCQDSISLPKRPINNPSNRRPCPLEDLTPTRPSFLLSIPPFHTTRPSW